MRYDVAVVGGGIIGLATARALIDQRPDLTVLVIEKEPEVARHQSGRNSGVLHSGLYYQPGSLKARLCVEGAAMMLDFCREHGVPFTRDGKVVVAISEVDRGRLDELERRGRANGLAEMKRIGPSELRELEPHAAGRDALFVPSTGAVDFAGVTRALAGELVEAGGEVAVNSGLRAAAHDRQGWRLTHESGEASAQVVINCAGLYSDRIARLMGVDPPVRIVPFRGEYLTVKSEAAHRVRSSIYPVPDPDLPFLGVHLTRKQDGTVEAGPSAVFAWAREGYRRSTVSVPDIWDAVSYPGTRRLFRTHWRSGLHEMARSFRKRLFTEAVQRLVPDLQATDFHGSHAGVRAQALTPDGRLADDFVVSSTGDAVHVLNAPSPGATSSLAIGRMLAAEVLQRVPRR